MPWGNTLVGAMMVATLGWQAASQAQVSPHCERNDRRDYCAVTVNSDRDSGYPSAWIVWADHSKVEVIRDERSCHDSGPVRTYQASMRVVPGEDQPVRAQYRGTAYEGGYRHEYSRPGLKIAFSYLD